MKFATILREASISEKFFPKCAKIDVVLYEDDDEINTSDDVKFVKPLFEDNLDSFKQFFNFVEELDKNPEFTSINVLITEHHVVVQHKTPHAKAFRRTAPFDPLDIAD